MKSLPILFGALFCVLLLWSIINLIPLIQALLVLIPPIP
jgi:hypothetical protein